MILSSFCRLDVNASVPSQQQWFDFVSLGKQSENSPGVNKENAIAEALRVMSEFLQHAEKCLAGVNRIQINSFSFRQINDGGKFFRTGQCISPSDIAVNNVNISIAVKIY